MGGKIPRSIKTQVLTQWLLGVSRDQIARNTEIGAGTVRDIIKEYKGNDCDFDLLREFVVTLKKEGTDLGSFASAIRLRRLLEGIGLNEDEIESLVVSAEVHCFKHEMEPKKFFDIVDHVCTYSNSMGIRFDELPDYLVQQQRHLQQLGEEVKRTNAQKLQAPQDYDITIRELEEEIRKRDLLIEKLLKLVEVEEKSHNLTKERRDYYHEKFIREKAQWLVPEHKLDQANKQLHN